MPERDEPEARLIECHATLAQCYSSLPVYNSYEFWRVMEATTTPLEIIARCFRVAHLYEDYLGRDRLFSLIVQRIHTLNVYWAQAVLKTTAVSPDVHSALVNDLCADLYECVLRALLDLGRRFWEEHFLHCLRLERQHVYKAFMMREGYWQELRVKRSMRVPRSLVMRLDTLIQQSDVIVFTHEVEDEQAEKQLLAVERTELLELVHALPIKLKTILYLLFWEGRSEKEIARLLQITDRTVRNRKKEALHMLQLRLQEEGVQNHEAKIHS